MRQEVLNLCRIYFFTQKQDAVERKNSYRIFIYKGKENENVARKYKRLNYEDRKAIEAMCKQGKRAEEIAEAMDVHRATIYHELKRGGAENGNRKQYSADMAQKAI